MAELSTAIQTLLAAHPSISHDAARNKLVCSITKHEMPATELLLKQYICGKRYKMAKEWAAFESTSKEFKHVQKHLVEHRTKPGLFYCRLTMRDVPRVPATVFNHITSKQFIRKLTEKLASQEKAKARAERAAEKAARFAAGEHVSDSEAEEADELDEEGEEDLAEAPPSRKRKRVEAVPDVEEEDEEEQEVESDDGGEEEDGEEDFPILKGKPKHARIAGSDDDEEEEEGGEEEEEVDEELEFEDDDDEEEEEEEIKPQKGKKHQPKAKHVPAPPPKGKKANAGAGATAAHSGDKRPRENGKKHSNKKK